MGAVRVDGGIVYFFAVCKLMAVRLLAGPLPIRGSLGEKGAWTPLGYWPHSGLMVQGNYDPVNPDIEDGETSEFGLHRVALDGIACSVGGFYFHSPMSWWPARKRMVAVEDGEEWSFEPKAMIYQPTGPGDQPDNDAQLTQFELRPYVKLTDRRLFFQSARIWACYPGEDPVAEGPYLEWIFGSIRPGRSETEVCVAGAQGIIFYDTVKQEVSSPKIYLGVMSNTIYYVPEYEVFISAHTEELDEEYGSEDTIRVWSLEVEATTISEVEVYEGEVKSGQVVTYRVQVTGTVSVFGADPDLAVGELVDWSLNGVGNLLQIQTKVDAEGYAYCQVQYLVDEVGDSTVTASVTC
jgi:hypothetical protein